ncbi:BTA121 domain-containing protein surface lipoprotein [Borrelia coriaceae]|uniref:BTA121 domain-containing protein surface lipoprotein n=1 Tax=Borrelia coriaceae TaxID=144 RepID=UPI003CCBA42D
MNEIKGVLTDASIAGDKNYKTSTDLEFYYLLNKLEDFKVKEIINLHLNVLRARENAIKVIVEVLKHPDCENYVRGLQYPV